MKNKINLIIGLILIFVPLTIQFYSLEREISEQKLTLAGNDTNMCDFETCQWSTEQLSKKAGFKGSVLPNYNLELQRLSDNIDKARIYKVFFLLTAAGFISFYFYKDRKKI